MQPILPITVPVKKIKGAACQCDGDGDGVVWCEQTLTMQSLSGFKSVCCSYAYCAVFQKFRNSFR